MITKRRKLKASPAKRRRAIPYDDEPLTVDDIAAIKQGRRDRKAGRVYTMRSVKLLLAMHDNLALARVNPHTQRTLNNETRCHWHSQYRNALCRCNGLARHRAYGRRANGMGTRRRASLDTFGEVTSGVCVLTLAAVFALV